MVVLFLAEDSNGVGILDLANCKLCTYETTYNIHLYPNKHLSFNEADSHNAPCTGRGLGDLLIPLGP